jgi:hypothetical protein
MRKYSQFFREIEMWIIAVLLVMVLILGMIQAYFEVEILRIKHSRPPWQPPQEVKFDPSIATPQQNLYLLQFINNPMGGPRCCKKMWYAFRYVNADGRYGALGSWTTLPVFAGAKVLPCIPESVSGELEVVGTERESSLCSPRVDPAYGGCGRQCTLPGGKTGPCVSVGNQSCSNNRPTIGITSELDYVVNRGDWYAVLHRQLDRFDPTSEGEPVGFLIGHDADQTGGTYSWPDVAFSDKLGTGCIC